MRIRESVLSESPERMELKKYGKCILCGDRVNSLQDYITTSDGYCHRPCLSGLM